MSSSGATDPSFDPTSDSAFAGVMSSDQLLTTLGAEIIDWTVGSCRVQCAIDERHTNLVGTGHGAVLFALGDIAMSIASNSHGRVAVAVRLDITYHRPVRVGDLAVATASERTRSRRFGSYDLAVEVGDKLVASMSGLTYRTDDWHPAAELWPASFRDER